MSREPRRFTISSARETAASPEAVMRRVTRPETWPDWVPEILEMDRSGPLSTGDEVEGLAEMLGFRVDGRSRIVEVRETRLVQDVVIGVRMTARYVVESAPGGTTITHELVVTRPEGIMGRVLAFFLRGRLRAMQKRLLENLARQSEGENAAMDAVTGAPPAGT